MKARELWPPNQWTGYDATGWDFHQMYLILGYSRHLHNVQDSHSDIPCLLHHADRGCQFLCHHYCDLLVCVCPLGDVERSLGHWCPPGDTDRSLFWTCPQDEERSSLWVCPGEVLRSSSCSSPLVGIERSSGCLCPPGKTCMGGTQCNVSSSGEMQRSLAGLCPFGEVLRSWDCGSPLEGIERSPGRLCPPGTWYMRGTQCKISFSGEMQRSLTGLCPFGEVLRSSPLEGIERSPGRLCPPGTWYMRGTQCKISFSGEMQRSLAGLCPSGDLVRSSVCLRPPGDLERLLLICHCPGDVFRWPMSPWWDGEILVVPQGCQLRLVLACNNGNRHTLVRP